MIEFFSVGLRSCGGLGSNFFRTSCWTNKKAVKLLILRPLKCVTLQSAC